MTNKLQNRVLLIEDDEDDMLIIKRMLAKIKGDIYMLDWVNSYDEAVKQITDNKYDLYLVDYRLGQQSGLDLLKSYNLTERQEPFIILTGAKSKSIENSAMKMGVADYLVKGQFDVELLSRVLRYSLQRKLIEAQRIEELIEINKSKDEFISLASHQLRTPATAVKQYIGMVLEGFTGDITEQQRACLESAYNGNERQLKIVDTILGVARLDLKKTKLNLTDSNIVSLIEDAITDVGPEIESREQRVIFNEPQKPIIMTFDKTYLSMAISNLIDNASKYSFNNKTITVKLECDEYACTISISDQGVGISPEDIPKLFKKFSRIDNPLSVAANGTGVGLYWSYEVIKLHGGNVAVESEIGAGSTFKVELPNLTAKN